MHLHWKQITVLSVKYNNINLQLFAGPRVIRGIYIIYISCFTLYVVPSRSHVMDGQ